MKGAWECTCGGHYTPGDRIQELLTDTYLFQRYDMIPYSGWPTLDFIDFEAAFESTCARILDHINCEKSDQTIRSTAVKGDFSTWDAACECGNSYNVNTVRVSEDLFDAITKPWIYGLLVRPNPALHVWDTCASYSNVCSHFLDKIQCPSEIQVINSCDSMDPLLNGSLEVFNGTCICGNFDDISFRPMEAIIDSLLGQSIYNEFWYIPQVHPLYTTVIGASPFKQFMHQIDA